MDRGTRESLGFQRFTSSAHSRALWHWHELARRGELTATDSLRFPKLSGSPLLGCSLTVRPAVHHWRRDRKNICDPSKLRCALPVARGLARKLGRGKRRVQQPECAPPPCHWKCMASPNAVGMGVHGGQVAARGCAAVLGMHMISKPSPGLPHPPANPAIWSWT